MATLYLHIGTPKTGTSAIQEFLYSNREILEKQGFCYPEFGYRYTGVHIRRNAHFLVHHQICKPENEAKIRKEENERFYEGLDKIKELTGTFPNVVLSDENVWNGYVRRENFWKVLSDALSERGIDLKVIVYLRSQDLVLESYYSQRVKVKIQMSFQEYLDSEDIDVFKLDYYRQLKEIEQAIGKENIIVRVYEKQQYEGNGNTLISDFLNVLGLELDEKYISPDKVVNTSLYGKALELKRILNGIDGFVTRRKHWLVNYLKIAQEEDERKNGTPAKKFFTYEKRMDFLAKYKEGNEAIAREFLNREDGVLFRDEIIKDYDVVGDYSTEELVLMCGRLLQIQNEAMEKKIEGMSNKLAATQKELDKVKRQLAYERRPLYKKAVSKMRKVLSKKK